MFAIAWLRGINAIRSFDDKFSARLIDLHCVDSTTTISCTKMARITKTASPIPVVGLLLPCSSLFSELPSFFFVAFRSYGRFAAPKSNRCAGF